jgi:hypothetical protein
MYLHRRDALDHQPSGAADDAELSAYAAAVSRACRARGLAVDAVDLHPDAFALALHARHDPWEQRVWWWQVDAGWACIEQDAGTTWLLAAEARAPAQQVAARIAEAMAGNWSGWSPIETRPPDLPAGRRSPAGRQRARSRGRGRRRSPHGARVGAPAAGEEDEGEGP